ncbi:MAG: DUF434 domain-containing protein [Sedimentisphaerales bacterium]|nr:DUF434 domain-containing protein [Sedimentisphaerales bacterium]
MPDKRRHRGAHPADMKLFGPAAIETLRRAVRDYGRLLGEGYAPTSSLKLVGDHFDLTRRQRLAVMRSACPEPDRLQRRAKQIPRADLAGRRLWLDGYNVLTTVEAALAGGVILIGRDGCCRDLAGMHGTYRKVAETLPTIGLAGEFLAELGLDGCRWYLDRPVSNSGRLKALLEEEGQKRSWNWQVELAYNPDDVLAECGEPVATGDSEILRRCQSWFNLARRIIERDVPDAWLIDLSDPVDGGL